MEQNDSLYDDCFRITSLALERHPAIDPVLFGIATAAATARAELTDVLRNVIIFSGHQRIHQHLQEGIIHWPDVAREFIADVLSSRP